MPIEWRLCQSPSRPAVWTPGYALLMFLIIFTLVFGNETIEPIGVTTAQFFAPSLAVFGAVSATYTTLAITTASGRSTPRMHRSAIHNTNPATAMTNCSIISCSTPSC